MAAPPFPDGSFDLVWSEGAIYLVGFEAGLRRWRRLLRPGGYVAVTEAAWLVAQPAQEAVDFWTAEYPAITTIERNLATIRSAGFEPVDPFVLPAEDWSNYYEPLQEELDAFRARGNDDPHAQSFADDLQREIDLWHKCGDSYGYVFYIGRVSRPAGVDKSP
jgi:SAM-dependent methyltransferase